MIQILINSPDRNIRPNYTFSLYYKHKIIHDSPFGSASSKKHRSSIVFVRKRVLAKLVHGHHKQQRVSHPGLRRTYSEKTRLPSAANKIHGENKLKNSKSSTQYMLGAEWLFGKKTCALRKTP